MNLLQLPLSYTKRNKGTFIMNVLLIVLAISIVFCINSLQKSTNEQMRKNLKGIDMVIGAKGSPLQLALSNVFHIDNPTGNIAISELEKIEKHPLIKKSIRLAYGDSYKGFRILGTTTEYVALYNAKLQSGKLFESSMEAVIGSNVAKALDFEVGDHFHGLHGDDEEHGHVHEGHSYNIEGVLAPTNSVIDNLIITPISSVWSVHTEENKEADKEVTAALLQFEGDVAYFDIPELVNKFTPSLQTANPAYETTMLREKMGAGYRIIHYVGLAIGFVAILSILISLLNAMRDRKIDLALLRTLGASKVQLIIILYIEIFITLITGLISGYLIGKIGAILLSISLLKQYYLNPTWGISTEEIYFLSFILIVGLISGIIPAIKCYKVNISKTLSYA